MNSKLVVHAENPLVSASKLFRAFAKIGVEVERRGYDVAGMSTEDETHLVWGMGHRLDVYRTLAQIKSIWFLENGWLTPKDGCVIDAVGSNGMSSIRGAKKSAIGYEWALRVKEWVERLHNKHVKGSGVVDYPYILVPLQVETDSNIRYWSCLPDSYRFKTAAFVDMVCEAFPNKHLVFRPHPRDPATAERVLEESKGLREHKHAEFFSVGTSYDWIKGATAVVGINSTVLIEALTFPGKPVAAVGVGVFSEHGVMVEAKGSMEKLRDVLSFKPDPSRVVEFLGLLYERQVPYGTHPDEFACFPVLMDMLDHAKRRS